jgi:hypothetical protein
MKKLLHYLYYYLRLINAQAFKGDGDVRTSCLNLQDGGTGILYLQILELDKTCHWDLPLITYYRCANPLNDENCFGDRVDLKVRFNANLGSVMQLEPNMDIYPGLFRLKNFGAHLGFRYFFTEGLDCLRGWSSISRNMTNSTDFGHSLNNQFTLNIGA